jgi:hypothetical protein
LLGPYVDLAVSSASVTTLSGGTGYLLNADLIVRNRSFDKQVELLYSFDQWKTTLTTPAQFQTGGANAETWKVGTSLNGGVHDVQFAARVIQAGQTAWDNNFRQNFECRQGSDQAWQCTGADLLSCGPTGCTPVSPLN